MKGSACPRAFEAEAMRDQRLGPAELASFERHLGRCDECSREVRSLEALAAPLRESAPHGQADELHARRERARLLLAFDELSMQPQRPRPRAPLRLRVLLPAAAAVVLLAAGGWFVRARMEAAPSIAVRAGAGTLWSGRTEGPHPLLVLERGTLFVRVDSRSKAAPLRVVLPDGELEDIGTVFTVRAEAGRTARVSVREGSVVLRIHGAPARVIGAGETWTPELPSAAAAHAIEPTAPAAPAAATTAPPRSDAPRQDAAERREAPRSAPAREFRAAVALLETGENREAAAAFARFAARHPRDARAEDAAYLRVLALLRAGARAELASAAQQYLREHPAGLRRVEVERIARNAAAAAPVER